MRDYLDDATLKKVMGALSRKRRRGTKPCEECGTLMENVLLSRQRFCSNKCTVAAWRKRKAAPTPPAAPPASENDG